MLNVGSKAHEYLINISFKLVALWKGKNEHRQIDWLLQFCMVRISRLKRYFHCLYCDSSAFFLLLLNRILIQTRLFLLYRKSLLAPSVVSSVGKSIAQNVFIPSPLLAPLVLKNDITHMNSWFVDFFSSFFHFWIFRLVWKNQKRYNNIECHLAI